MAVRVKIKVDSTVGKSLKTVRFAHQRLRLMVALVNTGFETLSADYGNGLSGLG